MLCSTLPTLAVARAERLLVCNVRVIDLASALQTHPSWDKNSSFADAFHKGNSDEPCTFWGYWAQAPLTPKEDTHQGGQYLLHYHNDKHSNEADAREQDSYHYQHSL